MATNGTAPPAYHDGAPPAYAPSYDGPSAPQPAPVQYAPMQTPQMPVTQQLSNVQPVGGQQVVYMMQQPDGSLVPVQAMPQEQGVQYQQPQIMYQQPQTQPQPQPTAYVSNTTNVSQQTGNGEPGAATNTTNGQKVQFKPREPDPFDRKLLSWTLLVVSIIYICHLVSTFTDVLTYYEDDSGDYLVYFKHDEIEFSYDGSSSSYGYDDYCDYGIDDYCDYENDGSAFWAFHVISVIIGSFIVVLLCNILGKCCQCWPVQRQITISKVGLIVCGVCSMIALCIWQIGSGVDICDDASGGTCGWGFTSIMCIILDIGYTVAFRMLMKATQQ